MMNKRFYPAVSHEENLTTGILLCGKMTLW